MNMPGNPASQGNMANNGSLPLTKSGNDINPPNTGPGGDHRQGSFPIGGGSGSPYNPPNNTPIPPGRSATNQSPGVMSIGTGAIPISGQNGR